MKGDGFLAIWSDVPSEHETDYLHWLTREHTSERLAVEGFLGVCVYRALRRDVCRYFIHYRLATPAVLASAAYLDRLNAPTPWSQRVMPILGNFARGGGRVLAETGQGHGCVLAAIKLDRCPRTFTTTSWRASLPRTGSSPHDCLRPILAGRASRHARKACGQGIAPSQACCSSKVSTSSPCRRRSTATALPHLASSMQRFSAFQTLAGRSVAVHSICAQPGTFRALVRRRGLQQRR